MLKKQLDQKWRTLDQFEASLRKLEAHKLQWKAKYAIKEGELEAAKVCPLLPCLCPSTHTTSTSDTHHHQTSTYHYFPFISQAR
jgi:hypothetical protein